MNLIEIPIGSPDVEFTVTLGEDVVSMRLRWNARAESWYIDIADADDVPIISGVRIAVGSRIGGRSAHPFFARNLIVPFDTASSGTDPGLNDLGRRVVLTWSDLTAEES